MRVRARTVCEKQGIAVRLVAPMNASWALSGDQAGVELPLARNGRGDPPVSAMRTFSRPWIADAVEPDLGPFAIEPEASQEVLGRQSSGRYLA